MGLHFGILGSLQITVDGREVALDSPKQRRLLGALLVDVGAVLSADRLAEVMWGDDPPKDPFAAVQTHVSRLRALLDREGGAPARRVVVTRPPGYVLAVACHQVDACRFERQVEQARSASTPHAAADLLQDALRLWRGDPLVGFDHDLARAEAARLEELWTTAVELRADALLAMGRCAEAIAGLELAVARHPLRERLRGQLMVALVRDGRQAEALAVYRDLRDVLVDELGVEPTADLRRLERAVLQQDPELPWPEPAARREGWRDVRAPGRRPGATNLPAPLTSFVGREADVRGVVAALSQGRIVTLTGVGGVGKSRLAAHVARQLADEHPDGVRVCDLVGASDPSAVPDVVATTLGVLPGDTGGTTDALLTFLRAQDLLLVLDNCEHVLDGAAELVAWVARRCPAVDVLATSRQPLGVDGERTWPVRPLEVGEGLDGAAVSLFGDRAAAADPSFALDDADRQSIAEICRRLDGLPLAIELAAARVRSMTPADIADRLDHPFELFTGPARAAAPRHRSLRAVVDWSHAQLPETSRRLFDRLAVFAGGFGIHAAERVCAGEDLPSREVAARLAELVDHSLVVVDRSGRHARYRLLETLRHYGRARLEERGELATWQRRHAEHFGALVDEAATGLEGPEEGSWMHAIDMELANLRAAHAWARATGHVDLALRLPSRLREYAFYGLRDEVYDWALRALDLPGAVGRAAHPAALVTAGVGWVQRGQLERAQGHAHEAVATASEEDVLLRGLRLLAEIALYQGRLEETERVGREVVAHARAVGRPYDEALGHLYRVHAATYAGRDEDASTLLAAGWRVAQRIGTPSLRAGFWFLEGEVRLDRDPETALAAFQEAIEAAQAVSNRFIEGVARVAAAAMEARHGHPTDALTAFREIVDHWRTSGDWAHMWTTLHNLVALFERVGAERPAATLLGAVETATTGGPAFGEDAARLTATADALHASMGEGPFTAARERGRHMSDDQAVVRAMEEIDRLLAATDGPPAPGGPGPRPPSGSA